VRDRRGGKTRKENTLMSVSYKGDANRLYA
jgi:hypothetical protein